MKIELDLTVEELIKIVRWFEPQGLLDTEYIINTYNLPINPIDTERALFKLFDQLDDIMEVVK